MKISAVIQSSSKQQSLLSETAFLLCGYTLVLLTFLFLSGNEKAAEIHL